MLNVNVVFLLTKETDIYARKSRK